MSSNIYSSIEKHTCDQKTKGKEHGHAYEMSQAALSDIIRFLRASIKGPLSVPTSWFLPFRFRVTVVSCLFHANQIVLVSGEVWRDSWRPTYMCKIKISFEHKYWILYIFNIYAIHIYIYIHVYIYIYIYIYRNIHINRSTYSLPQAPINTHCILFLNFNN